MQPWIEREQFTHLDNILLEGLQNLDGNQVAWTYRQDHTRDKEYPLVAFPSGVEREIGLRGRRKICLTSISSDSWI